MSERFGECAMRLCTVATHALGWRPDEFWSATPQDLRTALRPMPGEVEDAPDRATIERMMEQENANNRRG